ncbi:amino acid transporter [Jiella marina]|uniref:amino acid transporter n=1 Tax=Jiella sp. LLJ827 TaxID=2917712 RepID=UPI0021011A31|nr:amino acid transporter [Jiella sp. LLJ827]MCQ0989982.1 amino acid transporter [Jiella sp. LLJ827]
MERDFWDVGTGTPTPRTEAEREQIKLQAAYSNGIAIGLFLIGGLSIPSTILVNVGQGWLAIAVAMLCFLASFALHKFAKRTLRELDK